MLDIDDHLDDDDDDDINIDDNLDRDCHSDHDHVDDLYDHNVGIGQDKSIDDDDGFGLRDQEQYNKDKKDDAKISKCVAFCCCCCWCWYLLG